MCRSITILRGLDPPATEDEVTAAARQYLRKVSGATSGPALSSPAFEAAVAAVARATQELLSSLPPRQRVPTTVPPNRRRAATS